jgi:ligand-binding sensor domain-containing protein
MGMHVKKSFFSLLLSCFLMANQFVHAALVQTNPMVFNYPKSITAAGTQTWDITHASNGLIFFANNDGLLVFDGKEFTKYPLPAKSILRSIYYDSLTQRVYAGGQNEIGYYAFDSKGKITFTSLAHLLPHTLKGFEDVWSIKAHAGNIYFQTSSQLFVYNKGQIQLLKLGSRPLENSYQFNQILYVTDIDGTIYTIDNQNKTRILALNTGLHISSILPFKQNELLLCTFKEGLYTFKDNQVQKLLVDDAALKNASIYKAIPYQNHFLLATNRSGVFFLNEEGIPYKNINLKEGLQNNNVLSIHIDPNLNVWLGLNNGIDLLRLNYPYGNIVPDGLLKGTGYSMVEYGDAYYFGTNNGLYYRAKNNTSADAYTLVANTEGQVWSIQVINGKLFMCHHEGLFEVKQLQAEKILDCRGAWKIKALSTHSGNFILGTYNGVSLLKWDKATLIVQQNYTRFKESSRFIEEDADGNIWVGHPYKGMYQLKLSADLSTILNVKLYGKKQGLPAETENYVFNTDLGLTFNTQSGIYSYNEQTDRFELAKLPQDIIDTKLVYKRLINGTNGNIWYITANEIGCFKPTYNGVNYGYSKIILPLLEQNLVGGFEFLFETANQEVFIGTEIGFVAIDLKKLKQFSQHRPQIMFTSIHGLSNPDSVYFNFLSNPLSVIELEDKSLEISYSSPNGYCYKDLEFSTYLEAWDKSWTPWKSAQSREFSRLSYGTYHFHVKAKYMGKEGPDTVLTIVIEAPWYWSLAAKIAYLIVLVIVVIFIGFFPQRLVWKRATRIIAEKEDQYKNQTALLTREKEMQEKELIELKNQQLERELEHQARELASSTMHIVQKSEMLLSIKDKLRKIAQVSNDPKIKPELSELIKNIDKDALIDKEWEKFEVYFNSIHDRFTKVLKAKFPQLNANDIKMCAYLRMNLSSKEIASILNISVRGVEISRYRLRKKMNLESGINLTTYLSDL